jgi:hypothetical protein
MLGYELGECRAESTWQHLSYEIRDSREDADGTKVVE